MRVLFWGTPDFAAAPLRALLGEGFDVAAVVTQPDKPQGRLRQPLPPPVKRIALEENLACFQPASPRDKEFSEMISVMQPDISVVVAYGHILPKSLVDAPRLGTLNIHASLLPLLRGAAPIQAAIKQGFAETGITIMKMVPALDAGPIILQAPTEILEDETYGELQLRLSELGALTLIEALALIQLGEAAETPQDDSRATYASKVTRDDTRIDWKQSAAEVSRTIRAYDPKPGAFTTRRNVEVKLFGPRIVESSQGVPGKVLSTHNELVVACGEDAIRVAEVQPSGKNRMTTAEWARGRGVQEGDILGG